VPQNLEEALTMHEPHMAGSSKQGMQSKFRLGIAAFLCAALTATVCAQARDEEVDPPGRVGRISDLSGPVQLYSPSAGEWANAVRNRPITSGDRLATDAGARAEVRIGSTTVRLDSSSELEVLRIDDARIELYLHNGTASARLRSREAVEEFELRTGEGRFRAQRTGRYRIDRIDEASHLTVNSGTMVYEGPGSALTVYSGQRAEFWLDSANAAQYTITEPKRDAFAAWSSDRDRQDDRNASTRYVSPEMTGVEDLDRYGRWESSDEYGSLWTPRGVAAGWAPYSSGHWTWISPWGWTWVDDAPWGFAPFHYGRWVWYRSNWCWAPGTRVLRPVYAPALVAWVGGPHVSISVNVGGPSVGWFPLAPREIYVPSYRVSPRYVREVNVTHVTNITNVAQIINNGQATVAQRDFSNRKFPHAVTVVPTSVMTQRQPVAPAAAQWRERRDSGDAIREVTRGGTTLVAAPVEAPPTRSRNLESQLITAPGVGNAAAGSPAAPRQPPRGGPNLGDGRRGGGEPRPPNAAAPAAPVLAAPSPAVVAPAVITAPTRPMPGPVANPQPPQVAGGNAQQPAGPPRPQAPVVAPPVVHPVAPPVAATPARPQQPELRNRPQRPPGTEVPAAPQRVEAPAQPDARRSNHASGGRFDGCGRARRAAAQTPCSRTRAAA
jgi:FecR protein